jgi:hypothetical protein
MVVASNTVTHFPAFRRLQRLQADHVTQVYHGVLRIDRRVRIIRRRQADNNRIKARHTKFGVADVERFTARDVEAKRFEGACAKGGLQVLQGHDFSSSRHGLQRMDYITANTSLAFKTSTASPRAIA